MEAELLGEVQLLFITIGSKATHKPIIVDTGLNPNNVAAKTIPRTRSYTP
jgi:hypothetical protein